MDRNQLKNKLTSFEAPPPKGAWEKIVDALQQDEQVSERLYNYQQQPPLTAWKHIEKTLDGEAQAAKIIPFTTRFKRPIRYVAAASIIGIIAIVTTLLMKRTEAGALQAGTETTVPVKESSVIKKEEPQIVTTQNKEQPVIAHTSGFYDEESSTQSESSSHRKRFLDLIRPQNLASSLTVHGRFIPHHATKKKLFDFSSADNYMVYSDGDGNAMKLPKRLFSLVDCKEGDGSCKERIHQLQQKLSSAAITADFTGVLEMLRQLQ